MLDKLLGFWSPKKTIKKGAVAVAAYLGTLIAQSKLAEHGVSVDVDPEQLGASMVFALYALRDFLKHRVGLKWLP